MIRIRLGSSVIQFRRTVALAAAVCLLVAAGLLYLLNDQEGQFSQNINSIPGTFDKQNVGKNELGLLEQRLQRLEEELQNNRQMLGQIKETVRELTKDSSYGGIDSYLLLGNSHSFTSRLNRSSAHVMMEDCHFCGLPLVKSDIEMHDEYEKIKFDNPNGGVWKQGWNIQYNSEQWNKKKLKIIVVPHSHNDPGWLKTFERYFNDQTRHILNNMVVKLKEDERRRFIWAETSYLALWWEKIDNNAKKIVKRYLDSGQLEIVTGGWVMNDEASTHYFAMVDQMVEGHQWLEHHLEYKPKNGWAIDPFGMSPTMAYLLRRMGLDNMVIQRVHYSVKKQLAQKKGLEFLWRQSWDQNHTTDITCHMMPFYSYDVPHTCGPDPKICCQFDFKRLPGNKVNCPWRVPPVAISDKNVESKAWTLLDQYRKKSQLFRTNVVMIQLGDDFRYDKISEWDQQFSNYQKLFDYMNQREDWHVQAQFGTLEDYFTALRDETGLDERKYPTGLPTLIGDFFTYADRDDHYWSGYFTSRPFYKNMDRVLEAHLRGAEILFSLVWARMAHVGRDQVPFVEALMKNLVESRRNLGLFQHHDAITGTSKDPVVIDYATRMFQSIQKLQHVICQSSLYLLSNLQGHYTFDPNAVLFQIDEVQELHSSISKKFPLTFSSSVRKRKIFVYNSLSYSRREFLRLHVSTPNIEIRNSSGRILPVQISPVWEGSRILEGQFEALFLVEVQPLSLTSYSIESSGGISSGVTRATVTLYNVESLPDSKDFPLRVVDTPPEFSISSNYFTAVFSGADGMLRRIINRDDYSVTEARIQFLMYGTRPKGRDRSGAYLFLPDTAAQDIKYSRPHIRVIQGPLFSEVVVFLPDVEHHIRLRNSPGTDGSGIEIYNIVDVAREVNKELIMRFYTNISNQDQEFFTDLNGFQVIKRKIYDKIPLQGNVYPMATMVYLQDNRTRMTLVTGQPLGATSLKPGWLEVFLDRRLNQDDNRGLLQGVLDNKRTPSIFRLLLERRSYRSSSEGISSYPSLLSHHASLSLLHPMFNMIQLEKSLESKNVITGHDLNLHSMLTLMGQPLPCDIHLVNLRTLQAPPGGSASFLPSNSTALFLHRFGFDCHFKAVGLNCSTNKGKVSVDKLFPDLFGTSMEESSLSLMYTGNSISKFSTIQIPPMEILTLRLSRR
ncbi:alpha-mannosidase 2-like [Limulus polyphemus]|uniref:Alpha-mannosidase n=1 Tax=Limulus polyphemus TaxID=6850 RepID=A0ABM1BE14_LIMPO|nr:alpha-mannosidase 2-like [Limulus polyphemus]